MAVIGTFGSFTAARLGIYASQASLNVTGNNIANINTPGYTRQRMDLVSLYSTGADRYFNKNNINIGYGVLCDSVSQLRDPYLDIRFRNEQSSLGAQKAKLDGLSDLSAILDEVGKGDSDFGVIENQFNDFAKQLQTLSGKVGSEEYDSLVRSSASTLVKLLNTAAQELDTQYANKEDLLKTHIKDINTILQNIRDLNEEIRDAGIYGEKALEMRDTRNVLIDELSNYMKIDVTYTMEKIDQYTEVEKIVINLADTSPAINLVDGIYVTQLTMPEKVPQPNPDYDPTNIKGMKYIGWDGKPTDNEREAAVVLNTDDATKEAMPYMKWDPAANGGAGDYVPTADVSESKRMNPDYDPDDPTGMKYAIVEKDGTLTPTDDPDAATSVSNAEEGAKDKNLYLIQLEALTDSNGRFRRDEHGNFIDEPVDLTDTTLQGALQAVRELLTEEGEFASENDLKFDGKASTKRGIPYYEKTLDNLARMFAEIFNEANQMDPGVIYQSQTGADGINYFVDGNGNYITNEKGMRIPSNATKTDPDNPADKTEYYVDSKGEFILENGNKIPRNEEAVADRGYLLANGAVLKPEYAYYDGGVLFSNDGAGNDTTDINALNISVSKGWGEATVRLLSTTKPDVDGLSHTTANDNIDHFINLMNEKRSFVTTDVEDDASGGDYFIGTFQEAYRNISTVLADDRKTTTILYNNFDGAALDLDNQRQSVSGVDLNEEATNMMQFQKSYAAACRLLTTIDSMLDKLINGTAV